MKKDIHPKYYDKAQIECACGNKLTVGSTKEKIETEICSNCHPFFTGKTKIMDIAGRVKKFEKLTQKTVKVRSKKEKLAAKKEKKLAKSK